MGERRRLGLCYNCDEQFVRGHQCKRLFSLLITDDLEDGATDAEAEAALHVALMAEQPTQEGQATPTEETPRVSLYAIAGIRTRDTTVIPVFVNGWRLEALIDTGSSHTFADTVVARRIKLESEPANLRVTVANGDKVPCAAVARGILMLVRREEFPITCFSISLGGFDLVLGADYLCTLGTILLDLDFLRMAFQWRGRRVFWRGLGVPHSEGPEAHAHSVDADPDWPFIDDLLREYDDVFAEPHGLPPSRPYDHRMRLLLRTTPVAVPPYRYPQLQKDELECQCSAMLAQGIIRPSTSPFSAPVLLVKKADDLWRFCIDYRALNDKTSKDKFPIPVVDELHGVCFFTKLDLHSGYHQVRMHLSDVEKTAFRTHHGHFEFLVIPFGLSNAPATFQALMNNVLQPFLCWFVLVFFDDILIYSSSWTDHLQHIRLALEALRLHSLHVKRSKCSFGERSVAYLGHVISANGVAMDGDKVEAVASWAEPRSAQGVRGFLGLAGYYRKFIRDFDSIATPLTRLLRKEALAWTPEAAEAFAALKRAQSTGPVLQMPDFSRQFIVDCDASGTGFGAVLHQGEGPLAFFNRPFAARHSKLVAYERELNGLVQAVRHWRPYLWGRRFLVRTDHYSLKFLLDQQLSTVPQHQWLSKLFGFDFAVEY
jgi:hypothetical protein